MISIVDTVSDECAGSWLLAIPTRDNCQSAPVFRETLSPHLCLAYPALRKGGWVGKPVGTKGQVIDKFGDAVLCCHEIPGDPLSITVVVFSDEPSFLIFVHVDY